MKMSLSLHYTAPGYPLINIHQEINICVYSDLCWEQQLQRNIELCLDKWRNINYKEAIDLEYKELKAFYGLVE